jgi:hypothetical protein
VTEPLAPHGRIEECLSCGIEFTPRKAGHVFCSRECRHRGERPPDKRAPIDHGAIERLFDEARDPSERCRDDDWYPESCAEFKQLDAVQTGASRRRWYTNLLLEGQL